MCHRTRSSSLGEEATSAFEGDIAARFSAKDRARKSEKLSQLPLSRLRNEFTRQLNFACFSTVQEDQSAISPVRGQCFTWVKQRTEDWGSGQRSQIRRQRNRSI